MIDIFLFAIIYKSSSVHIFEANWVIIRILVRRERNVLLPQCIAAREPPRLAVVFPNAVVCQRTLRIFFFANITQSRMISKEFLAEWGVVFLRENCAVRFQFAAQRAEVVVYVVRFRPRACLVGFVCDVITDYYLE